ncbi:MAG TPA: SDR family NAD(P)-dependent oxidoreductase, partial [Pseudolabrys sp.]|nr:SDR family NAD(P)-dependent oxidoreductase [Pseudolabrys sp.]
HGDTIAIAARREAQLDALADEIAKAGHMRPHVIAADLGAPDGTKKLAQALAARDLEPAVVVNNAGFGLLGPAADLDRAEELAIVDLNVRALTDLSLRWIDSLIRHRGGILNVASIAAFLPGPGMAVYHATKAYVLSFSEALHKEMVPSGVRVTALCPGPVRTEFMERAGIPRGYFPRFLGRSADRVAREGYDGFMQGKRVIVPGLPNKVVTLLPRLLPRGIVLGMTGWRAHGTDRRDR